MPRQKLAKFSFYLLLGITLLFGAVSFAAGGQITGISYYYPDEPDQDSFIPVQDITCTMLTDGALGAGGSTALWSQWDGSPKVIINFDLKGVFNLDKVILWTREDEPRQHIGRFLIYTSMDGKGYKLVRTVNNPQAPLQERPTSPKIYSFGAENLNAKARFVRIVSMRDTMSEVGISQQIIEDIEFWGEAVPPVFSQNVPPIEIKKAEVNTYSSVKLDLGDFFQKHPDLDVRVYVAPESFSDVQGLEAYREYWFIDPKERRYLMINGLTPNHTHYIGLTAVTADNQQLRFLKPVKIHLPGVLEVTKVGDIFGMNAYPYIELLGSHENRGLEAEQAMFAKQLKFMGEAKVKYNRWWRNYPCGVLPYVNEGVTFLAFLNNNLKYIKDSNRYGIWLFGGDNEPNLFGRKPAEYLAWLKEGYQLLKQVSPENTLVAPTVHSITAEGWVKEFYEAGGKDYFDALDIHMYQSTLLPVPKGLRPGAPEGILLQIATIREFLAAYGDENRPLITSETGTATHIKGGSTLEEQAIDIVRRYLHFIAGGFRRVFWYALQDEGTDEKYQEHNFGIIDYSGNPKPAYYALKNLTAQLGETVFDGEVKGVENPYYHYAMEPTEANKKAIEGLDNPYYGYKFKKLNEDGYISVLWDAGGESNACIKISEDLKTLVVYDMYGKRSEYPVNEGKVKLVISQNPVYVHTVKPIEVVSVKRLPPPPTFTLSLTQPRDIFAPGGQGEINMSISNTFQEPIEGKVWLEGEFACEPQTFKVGPSSKADVSLDWSIAQLEAGLYSHEVKIELSGETARKYGIAGTKAIKKNFWVTTTAADRSIVSVKDYTGDGKKDILLANQKWEVLLDPNFGGRIILLIDKESTTNQVHTDFQEFKDICVGPEFGLWDALGNFTADLWQANYAYDLIQDDRGIGVKLQATAGSGVEVTKEILLPYGEEYLEYIVKIHNPTKKEVTVNYTTHPEFTVGGRAESERDIIYFPGEDGLLKYPYVAGLGERGEDKISEGWWAVTDIEQGVTLGAVFDAAKVDHLRQWWGANSHNIELSIKPVQLKAGENYEFATKYFFLKTTDPQAIASLWEQEFK